MKPAPFEYHAPKTLPEALDLMARHGWDAKALAGGQSLVPAMNFRLAQPAILVDLNRIKELDDQSDSADELRLGAMTRQRLLETSPLVADRAPLIHQAMPLVAHVQIRNRGTLGGSLAHADPAAELPAVMVALQGRFRLANSSGERWVTADEFYTGLFTTALEPDELLVEVSVPAASRGYGSSFREFARRHGDYALVGVAVSLRLDAENRCQDCRIVFMSVGERPVLASKACALLQGEPPSPELTRQAAQTASQDDIDPHSDIHASADYRRHLAKVLLQKAFVEATRRAQSA